VHDIFGETPRPDGKISTAPRLTGFTHNIYIIKTCKHEKDKRHVAISALALGQE
jgi:hypothetical protein